MIYSIKIFLLKIDPDSGSDIILDIKYFNIIYLPGVRFPFGIGFAIRISICGKICPKVNHFFTQDIIFLNERPPASIQGTEYIPELG